jgi:hypothetical protein
MTYAACHIQPPLKLSALIRPATGLPSGFVNRSSAVWLTKRTHPLILRSIRLTSAATAAPELALEYS